MVRIAAPVAARLLSESMPRFFHFGVVLGAALLLTAPVAAQAAVKTQDPTAAARVEHVVVHQDGSALTVEIQTSGAAVAPDTQAIAGPDRIVIDFPGAMPAADLRALQVNRGGLKRIRSGLFFSNPPITRVVLDLEEPQSYQIATSRNAIVVTLSGTKLSPGRQDTVKPATSFARAQTSEAAPSAKLTNASLATGSRVAQTKVAAASVGGSRVTGTRIAAAAFSPAASPATSSAALPSLPAPIVAPVLAKPLLSVTFANGMLHIRSDKATLAQVLYEVQRQTQAEIAIPAGAEQEEVAADLGPAPAREVLASLLNGSPYNFIFVGGEATLERVILTRRDSVIP